MMRAKANRRKTVRRRPPVSKLPQVRINLRAVLVPPAILATLVGVFFASQALLDRPVNKLELQGAFQRVTPIQV